MNLSEKAQNTLKNIIEAHLTSYKRSYTEIFKENLGLKELYEATAKSTKEKLHRTLRKTLKSRKKEHLRDINLKDRIRPGKTANNDPSRGGNRIHNKPLKESLVFICNNLSNTGLKLQEAVNKFPHKETLKEVVRQFISTNLGGWQEKDGKYENKDGSIAYKKNWKLMEDGHLRPHGHKPAHCKLDWLIELRGYCD